MNNNNVPEELQIELSAVLQKICLFIHESSGMSNVIMDIRHASDCLARTSQTQVAAGVWGQAVRKSDGTDKAKVETMVNDLVKNLMDQAKAKNQEPGKE